MLAKVQDFLADENGTTAIEYGLIAAAVSLVSIAALTSIAGDIDPVFGTASSNIGPSASGDPSASLDASAIPTDGRILEEAKQ